MKLMMDFIKTFTNKNIGKIMKYKNRYYLVSEQVEICLKNIKLPATGIGLFLGSIKHNRFVPSLALLYLLSKISDRKTIVNKKQEWFFTNGKDLIVKGKTNVKEDLVLVQNKFDENIGLGMIQKRSIKNIIDVGDYLRREMF